MYEFLVRVLSASLRRHVGYRALYDLEKSLLYALSAYVPCDGRVLGLARYLVYLVYVYYASLCPVEVAVGSLIEPQQDVLNVFAHIARFCQ